LGSGVVFPLPNASGGAAFSAVETGLWVDAPHQVCSFEVTLSNTTTPSATVEIHGSNSASTTPNAGTLLGTIVLSGASDAGSFTASSAAYKYKLAKVTAIAGSAAAASIVMGV
jgi:hypothetical protein